MAPRWLRLLYPQDGLLDLVGQEVVEIETFFHNIAFLPGHDRSTEKRPQIDVMLRYRYRFRDLLRGQLPDNVV